MAGLLLAASVPPWGWWPLAFVGAALLYWRLCGLGWRARLVAGWGAGLGCFVPGLWWSVHFNWYGGVVLMAVEALFVALGAAVVPGSRSAWRAPAFAGAFTLAEAARLSWPFGGLPLGGVFLGQAGGPLLPVARLGGPLALTAVVWLGGAGLAELALAARGMVSRSAGTVAAGAACVVSVAALGVGGALAPAGGAAVGTLRVWADQGGARTGVLAAELAAARAVDPVGGPGTGRRRLVVWPEDSVTVGPKLAGTAPAAALARLARRSGATVVAGVIEDLSSRAFRNEAVVWGPSGHVVATYEKVHRVPFGEYVPLRGFFSHLATLSAVPKTAVPGHASGMVRTPAGPLGVMVSYEVFFAGRGRSAVRAGARLLVVPTNTTSYTTTQVACQELAADRVQAVAEGRDLVQAAPTGYSDVVTPSGSVLARSVLGRRQVVSATVTLRDGRTAYEILGGTPVLAAGAALVLAGLLGVGLTRSNRNGYRRKGPLPPRTWRG